MIGLLLIGVVLIISIVWVLRPTSPSSNARATGTTTVPRSGTQPVPSTGAPTSTTSGSATDPFGTATAQYVAGRSGTIAAEAYDLTTGQSWDLGDSEPQDEASIVKVDILEALLAQSGGQGLSTADQGVAQDMIENSDNDSATDLWDAAGSTSGIASFNSSAGLTDTTPSPCVECAGFPWPGWGLTKTVPADQITLLRRIVQPNSLLTTDERNYALGLMENVTGSERWGVTGGVPAQATVALKNGWLPLDTSDTDWQINSIGWISGQGRNYLLAVLTTGDPSEQYGIDTIDQISATVWQDLGESG